MYGFIQLSCKIYPLLTKSITMRRKYLLVGFFLFLFISISNSPVLTVSRQSPDATAFNFTGTKKPGRTIARPANLFWEQGNEKDLSIDTASLKRTNWYSQAISRIMESEYEIKFDAHTNSYASPNRKNNLRSFYTANKFTLLPRNDSLDKWKLELTTLGIYADKKLIYSPGRNTVVTNDGKRIQFNDSNNFITEYINDRDGVRQNFIIEKEPAGKPKAINLKLKTNKGWIINKIKDKEIQFAKATKTGNDKKVTYNSLKVWDANQKELVASFTVAKNEVSINVHTANAVYPITIDPLSTGTLGTPDWIGDDANQAIAYYGYSVAGAGDINADGYSDVIVGAPRCDDGANIEEGLAFVYYGSAKGLSPDPDATPDDADQGDAWFGRSVSTAGDINGDGYDDVIIGACYYDDEENVDEGRVFVYYGSVTGLSSFPDWIGDDADQAGAHFGWSVATAGNVNGDKFADIIIGASEFDDGTNWYEGRAFVYHGSALGLSTTPDSAPGDADQGSAGFGWSVACAGDVNGDGYSDVLIGAPMYTQWAPPLNTQEGRAYLYYGSATGISVAPDWIGDDGNQNMAAFGWSVASAGDVNGDGYSDVIIGAFFASDGWGREGRAFVHYGSAAGLSPLPDFAFSDADQAEARFGISVAGAGDVNGDGYSDVIIGAAYYNEGPINDEGRAFIHFGSAKGLSAYANCILDDADTYSYFGISVACAGDINGDGFADVIIGAHLFNDGINYNNGRAFVYYGGSPGTLFSLNAQFCNRDDVQIKWATKNEIHMQSFIVERSADGKRFTEAGEVTAKGMGSNKTDYTFTDKNVRLDLLYYRLKFKEKSGETSYTKTVKLERSSLVKGFIAPNPVVQGNETALVLESATGNNAVQISIYNLQGQPVFTANRMLQTGRNKMILSTKTLVKGMYVVHVSGNGIKESYQLVVQ